MFQKDKTAWQAILLVTLCTFKRNKNVQGGRTFLKICQSGGNK